MIIQPKPKEEKPVQLLLDKDAIREVISRYSFNVDLRRFDNVLRLWSDDGEFTTDDPGQTLRVKGKTALKEFFENAPPKFKPNPLHLQIDYVIEVDGDTAYAAGYQVIPVVREGDVQIVRCGFRAFEFERIDGQWRIQKTISQDLSNEKGCQKLIPEHW